MKDKKVAVSKFNSIMSALAGKDPQHHLDFANGFKAVITYTETINQMDCVADEYHAEGIKYTCQQCPLRETQTDGRKHHAECQYSSTGRTHFSNEACEVFYRRLKLGDITPKGDPQIFEKSSRLTEEDIEILRKEETWKGKKIRRYGGQRS